MSELSFKAKEFGIHSLRAGGATTTANVGVPDQLFKCHGLWRSENAKDGYIKNSVEKWPQVSKSLGLYLPKYTFFAALSVIIIRLANQLVVAQS